MSESPRKRHGVVVTGCLAIIGELGVRAPLRGYVCCRHWIMQSFSAALCVSLRLCVGTVIDRRGAEIRRGPQRNESIFELGITRAALNATARVESAAS